MSFVLDAIDQLDESQWMFHGSTQQGLKRLTPNRDDFMIDRAIGSHFAADRAVSQRFATLGHSLYGGTDKKPSEPGLIYKAKAPSRSQLQIVPQKNYRDKDTGKVFAKQSDQHAIETHVAGTVFSQPENKDMFKHWVKHSRMVDDATAEDIHTHLSQGRPPTVKKFGVAGSDKSNSFHRYVNDFGLGMSSNPDFKRQVVDKYLAIQHKRGIKGLVYTNTSPMETKPIDYAGSPHKDAGTFSPVRSKKTYVIFHPHDLELQHD